MGKGFVFYRGPSQIDGKPIVGILTTGTHNEKTGGMIQSWIIPDNGMNAYKSLKEGHDSSVCGSCLLRPLNGGGCYVQVGQAPLAVSKKFMAGGYPDLDEKAITKYVRGERLRLGSWGDPTAIPIEVWQKLLAAVVGHTGYTQFWRNPANQAFKAILMASVRTEKQAEFAMKMGWRYYRIRDVADPLMKREVVCPASKEADRKTSCAKCLLCDGESKRPSVSIIVHGSSAVIFHARKAREKESASV